MALIERSQNELDIIQSTSNIVPDAPEYNQGDYSALLQTVNSFAALVNRGDFERMEADTSRYEGVPFTREAMLKQFKEQNVDSRVIDSVMTSHVTSWEEAERRKAYVADVQQKEKQVAENFSTAGMIAAGVPMAILDVDSLLISPTLAGVRKVNKALNISTRLGKTVSHAGAGALVGAESMLTYEAVTGMYRDDSLIESAIIGTVLGGTLGYLTTKAPEQALTRQLDGEGRVLSAEEAKIEQLATAQKQFDDLTDVITELEKYTTEAKDTATQLDRAEKNDRGRVRVDNRIAKDQRKIQRDRDRTLFEDLRSKAIEARTAVEKATSELGVLVRQEKTLTRAQTAFEETSKARAELNKATAPLKGQVTKLKNQLTALKGKYDKDSTAARKDLKEKLDAADKKLRKEQAKLARLDTKLKLHDQETPTLLKNLATEKAVKDAEIANLSEDLGKATAARDEAKTVFQTSKAAYDNAKLAISDDVAASFETQTLREKLDKYNADLSPEGMKTLLKQRDLLSKDLEAMSNDDFNLSTLYGVRKQKENYVAKLSRELDSIGEVKDFRQSESFKRLPSWAQKLMISPIEKLLNSSNSYVSGFASLLHSGTVHHGKINNMTAWVVRQMLDDDLNRMHKAVIYSYKQAVKNGYTGKMSEFETEVAQNAYKVTGAMQRDLFTGIDGAIVGKERFELAKSRMGSLKRKYASDNEWINKATDEYLNYYEHIHARGNKLGMEAFTGSLGKGYVKRIYSAEGIEKVGRLAAIEQLVEAQRAFAIATNSRVDAEEMAEFLAKATTAVDSALTKEGRAKMLTKSLGAPRQSSESSLKQRGIDVFDDDIANLLEQDVVGTSQLYALNTHGRLALKEKIGVDNDEQIEKMLEQLGATTKEIDDLRVVIETIKGTREISKNPFDPFTRAVKAASSYSSAMHTLAFAVPTMTEVASIAKEFGWSKTIDTLIGTPQDVYKLYKEGTPSERNTIEMMVSYGDAYFATRANRFDVESTFDSVGKTQEFLDGIVRREAVFGGLLPLTDMLKMTTASLSVDFLARMSVAKKISDTDLMRIQDMGFGKEDLARIRDTLKVDATGRIGNTDRKTWGKLDREITAGVITMTERTILHPNGATLPKFMTNMNEGQFLPRVMFKFMRFPFESYERLLVRGIQEADAKQMMAVAGNIAMWTLILSAKDAIKEEDKQKYTGDDGVNKLMLDSFLYNSFTAFPISMADTMSGLVTGENLTNDYRYRMGGAVQSDYESLIDGQPRFAMPWGSVNIGDAVAQQLGTLSGLEELNKE